MTALLLTLVGLLAPPAPAATCTYRTYSWDVKLRKGVDHKEVAKPRAEVTDDEKDPDDPRCTVCSEDQALVEVPGVKPFRVCAAYADKVKAALLEAKKGGFALQTVVGYRVGRTRGAVRDGKRTEWSNHSFGTAVDINSAHNGMYTRCKLKRPAEVAGDIEGCRKVMGGRWNPKKGAVTVYRGGLVHAAFAKIPWRWGGDLDGQLKDFMHFSITGK